MAIFLENLFQALTVGLFAGCIYGIMCVGLSLIFGVMRVINFAQGEFLMLGMYLTIYIVGGFVFFGPYTAPLLAAAVSGFAVLILGYALHFGLLRQITGTSAVSIDNEGHNAQLVLTLGLSLVLQSLADVIFGTIPKTVPTPISARAWELGPFLDAISIFVNQARFVSALTAVAFVVAIIVFMQRTSLGKSFRAASDNPDAATYVGVDVDRAHRLAFALGVAITAIAGGLVVTYYPVKPHIGLEFIIIMYAGVVLGGMGSVIGAFWGGMTIGLIQQLSALFLPLQLQNTTIFVIFLIVILVRPNGFFGRAVERA